ncbi:hypothetical protein [Paenibacillus oceani]|uniref:Uncharacterized protein n=1 Tax=Paenibacillus oceani TaxID=2772510 RepID=A0A927CFZ8_9BACL|nr:hypothetical protein [Paenibacillus oceani]MBD2865958.1 hypothetical protein [Paenibacillus oceani]
MAQPRYVTDIDKLTQIPEKERGRLKAVTEQFVFRINAIEGGKTNLNDHQSQDERYGEHPMLGGPADASWFDNLSGSKKRTVQPAKQTSAVVSATRLSDMPSGGRQKVRS